jgi:anthranilate synthase component 2
MSQKIKLLMIDNYDSFTYNIVQYFGELGAQVEVFRNDEITVEGIAHASRTGWWCRRGRVHRLRRVFRWRPSSTLWASYRFWGCVWGTKAIGAALGGTIIRAQALMHGKTSVITTTQEGVFAGLPAAVHGQSLPLVGD